VRSTNQPPGCTRRWYNENGASLLLSLPEQVLQLITQKAGKEARGVCATMRASYGAPGCGLRLVWGAHHVSEAAEQLHAQIVGHPYPGAVLKLSADVPLQRATCTALKQRFPRLRELALPAGVREGLRSDYAAFRLIGLKALTSLLAPAAGLHSYARLIALRALSLTFCTLPPDANRGMNDFPRGPVCLVPLTKLTNLTRLALSVAGMPQQPAQGRVYGRGHAAAIVHSGNDSNSSSSSSEFESDSDSDDSDDEEGHGRLQAHQLQHWSPRAVRKVFQDAAADTPGSRAYTPDYVFRLLAALPKLAHLVLDVPVGRRWSGQRMAPLEALTHLELRCDTGVLLCPDAPKGGEVARMQVTCCPDCVVCDLVCRLPMPPCVRG
jgi:hypothetical protein